MTSAKLALACGSVAFCISTLGAASEIGIGLASGAFACLLAAGWMIRKRFFGGK